MTFTLEVLILLKSKGYQTFKTKYPKNQQFVFVLNNIVKIIQNQCNNCQ
jgi:hypothetical protein